jgi:hypothetical protein
MEATALASVAVEAEAACIGDLGFLLLLGKRWF